MMNDQSVARLLLAPHFRRGIQAHCNTLSWKQLVALIEEMTQQ